MFFKHFKVPKSCDYYFYHGPFSYKNNYYNNHYLYMTKTNSSTDEYLKYR